MEKLLAYKTFIEKCTKSSKSVTNYVDFKKINKWILQVDPDIKDGILSIETPEKATEILAKLTQLTNLPDEKDGVLFERAGNGQYISAFKTYIMFLNARDLFAEIMSDDSNNNVSAKSSVDQPLQQIFYGAPGTGKSHTIETETKGKEVIRVTFHPDSDYSTFVGAYKPTTVEVPIRDVTGKVIKENGEVVTETRIVYKYVPQAFLKAYVKAWKNLSEPVYLVIEEINRGNCAQIFGDIFQLLDRNENGYSSYEVDPDMDITAHLKKEFDKGIDANASDKVKNGEKMVLPPNLFIWATMNTSDQSLFPIDSAFKRRWDWKYMPIDEEKENWTLSVNGKSYSWSSFLKKINKEIQDTTSSEDKMLGFYFCKAENNVINADKFVSKVLFYIYNDVFKDYGLESREFFKDKENGSKIIPFQRLYKSYDSIDEEIVEKLLKNLDVEEMTVDEEVEDDVNQESKGSHHKYLTSVTFKDGTAFTEQNLSSHFEIYQKALKYIGYEKVMPIIENSGLHRLNQPLMSLEPKQEIIDSRSYSYYQDGSFYLVKGMSEDTYISLLLKINEALNLNMSVLYR